MGGRAEVCSAATCSIKGEDAMKYYVIQDINSGAIKKVFAEDLKEARQKADRWVRSWANPSMRTEFVLVKIKDRRLGWVNHEVVVPPMPPKCTNVRHRWLEVEIKETQYGVATVHRCRYCGDRRTIYARGQSPLTGNTYMTVEYERGKGESKAYSHTSGTSAACN